MRAQTFSSRYKMDIKTTLERLQKVAGIGNLDFLLQPNAVHKARLVVNGAEYNAYRVQYNNDRGPYKGGIRFHPEVHQEEVEHLAFWMSIKTALVNIPMGGGKGGVTVNPKLLSEESIKELSREYIKAFHPYLGVDKDIPAPDVYTNPQIMAYMLDEYEQITKQSSPGMITGKPLEIGGSLGRDTATAMGGFFCIEESCDKLSIKNPRVTIQGYGNAGSHAAKLLFDKGYTIIAVSDSKGCVHDAQGLDVDQLIRYKEEHGSVKGFAAEHPDLFSIETDILIPAAMGDSITEDVARRVQTKLIVELANGPVTPKADTLLHERNILVIPDILANAGGVTVSYYEWVQNRTGLYWDAGQVNNKLKTTMLQALNDTWDLYDVQGSTFRDAAYTIALKRLYNAHRLRKG